VGHAGSLIQGDGSSHSGEEGTVKESISQHYPQAVAQSDESYARKFGHYGRDSKRRCGLTPGAPPFLLSPRGCAWKCSPRGSALGFFFL
jgi:hypothetical protein